MYLLYDFVMVRALKAAYSEQPYVKLMKLGDVNHVGRKLFQFITQ